jgi:ubiquinone/menaquinone biosynthesis C-methylase UbiE
MDFEYVNDLRRQEIEFVVSHYGSLLAGKRVLEIGSGTGIQLARLSRVAGEVVGLDLADGMYRDHADPRVIAYDGHHIPLPDHSVDVVFSSNVLEHIAHRDAFQTEILRVLRPGGHCIHILPSHFWRLWTTLGTIIVAPARVAMGVVESVRARKWCLPVTLHRWLDITVGDRHGEFGNRVTEFYHFMPRTWRHYFDSRGWQIIEVRPAGMAYEGNMILAHLLRWSSFPRMARAVAPPLWKARGALSHVLGSACYVFVLKARGPQ